MSADLVGTEELPTGARRTAARDVLARWHLPLLLVLCGVLYLSGLGLRPLWDKDEGMHAATARTMLESGDWLTPYFNGEPFFDKPPLFTWLVALSFGLLGFSEFAARLPAALCGTAGVVLTYLLGRRMGGASLGWIAALVLATCFEYVVLSVAVVHDIALACAILLALLGLWRCAEPGEDGDRHGWVMFWLGTGLAILAKGPVGILPPALAVLFVVATGRRELLRTLRMGPGLLLAAALSVPWYAAMLREHPDYLNNFILERVVGSFGGESRNHHVRPFYYYVPVLLGAILPWTAYLPAALRAGLRAALVERDASARLLLLWLGATFAVFSLATSKLATYILPCLPAVALLVARVWRDAAARGSVDREIRVAKLAFVALLAASLLWIRLHPPPRWLAGDMTLEEVLRLGSIALAGQALVALLLVGSRVRAALAGEVATLAALLLVFTLSTAPKLASHRSSKELAARIDRWLPPGADLPVFGRVVGVGDAALFYTGRRALVVPDAPTLRDYLSSPEPVVCVLAEEHLPLVSELDYHVLERVGTRLIISNAPAPSDSIWQSSRARSRH